MTSPRAKDRIAELEAVLLEWFEAVRPGVPVFVLPDAPAIKAGQCISCGTTIPSGWRCAECLAAVNHVLAEFTR